MKKFRVLHPFNDEMNHNCVRGLFQYDDVCTVEAQSLEEAFKLSQNDFSVSYRELEVRSTSVGDIIVDVAASKHYMIKGIGFEEVPHTVSSYINWHLIKS